MMEMGYHLAGQVATPEADHLPRARAAAARAGALGSAAQHRSALLNGSVARLLALGMIQPCRSRSMGRPTSGANPAEASPVSY